MKAIVGLGNPGARYAKNRHNIGFMALEVLAARHRILLSEKDTLFYYGRGRICGEEVILVQPQTFMNESGKAVARVFKQHLKADAQPENLLVVHDEIDLPLGKLKMKKGGSDAGHNGLASVTEAVGADYLRFRMGVGRPLPGHDAAARVLANFEKAEWPQVERLVELTSKMVDEVLAVGLSRAQNRLARALKAEESA